MKAWIAVVSSVVLMGCSTRHAPSPLVGSKLAIEEPIPLAPSPRPPAGALWKEDVAETVRLGLGHFLQHVDVEPRLEYGEFRGWTITELRPREFWAGVDLRPGDVVTSINEMPIERDTQAYTAFESLKAADTLKIAYQRGADTRLLSFKIVPRSPVPIGIAGKVSSGAP